LLCLLALIFGWKDENLASRHAKSLLFGHLKDQRGELVDFVS